MIEVNISDSIKEYSYSISLGLIQAKVKVEKDTSFLDEEFEKLSKKIMEEYTLKELTSIDKISDSRDFYKKIGKEPSRYRVSSEALMRRLLQGKGLYRINSIVDINNLLSLISYYSVGSYDLSKIEGSVEFTIGGEGSTYEGIGKGSVNIENLPVLKDEAGYFGSPTSDSKRAMITNDTKEILMCIYSFSGSSNLLNCLDYGKMLLKKFANAQDIEIGII